GSPEYALTWKHWDMPSGPPICALRASGRRTSDSDCSGWPTPVAKDDGKSPEAHLAMKRRMGERDGSGANRTQITSLQVMAKAAGWPTPDTNQRGGAQCAIKRRQGGHAVNLQDAATLVAGWATPKATDGSKGGPNQTGGTRPQQTAAHGPTLNTSPAETEKR